MKRQHLAIALLLIFTGLISASSSNIINEYRRLTQTNQVLDAWEISSNFSKEENITLILRWNVAWSELDVPPLPANITLFAPDNGQTKFRVYFELAPSENPEQEQPVDVSSIELLEGDDDGLLTTNPIRQIGGITKQSGTYTARISREGLWWVDEPPRAMVFLKEIAQRDKPYINLLPVGVALCIMGIAVLIFGMVTARRTKEKKALRKKALGK